MGEENYDQAEKDKAAAAADKSEGQNAGTDTAPNPGANPPDDGAADTQETPTDEGKAADPEPLSDPHPEPIPTDVQDAERVLDAATGGAAAAPANVADDGKSDGKPEPIPTEDQDYEARRARQREAEKARQEGKVHVPDSPAH